VVNDANGKRLSGIHLTNAIGIGYYYHSFISSKVSAAHWETQLFYRTARRLGVPDV
jgi:hypothetical protein